MLSNLKPAGHRGGTGRASHTGLSEHAGAGLKMRKVIEPQKTEEFLLQTKCTKFASLSPRV